MYDVCEKSCQASGMQLAPISKFTDYRCAPGTDVNSTYGVVVAAQEVFTSTGTYIVSHPSGPVVKIFANGSSNSSEENGIFHQPGSIRLADRTAGVNCLVLKDGKYRAFPCSTEIGQMPNTRCACKGKSEKESGPIKPPRTNFITSHSLTDSTKESLQCIAGFIHTISTHQPVALLVAKRFTPNFVRLHQW